MDLEAFFNSYPLRVPRHGSPTLYHIPTQTMGTLLFLQRRLRPIVVTVLDIIPWLVRHQPELNTLRHPLDVQLYRLAINNLKRADAIIAISHYTKKTLTDELGIPPEKIFVTHLAVDHKRFSPQPISADFRQKYALDEAFNYILYVGSNDPRKNLPTLIRAIEGAKRSVDTIKLIVVGNAYFQREALVELIRSLGLQEDVVFIDRVPDQDLPLFYNVADVFVLPSLYEGFGLPVLEAMACGTATIVANATSLPELGGEFAPTFDPYDDAALAAAIVEQLNHPRPAEAWRNHAAQFTWERTTAQTIDVYHTVLEAIN